MPVTSGTSNVACAAWQDLALGSGTGSAAYSECGPDTVAISTNAVTGPGATSDNQHIVYHELCGNGEIIAKVAGITNSGYAGLFVHESSAAAGTGNSGITTTQDFEENERTVNEVYLSWVEKGWQNLTGTEKAALDVVAMQCPLLGGNAVYRARSLLSIVTGTLSNYDDSTACVGNEAFFAPPPSNSLTFHEQDLLTFPNPTAHTVTFSWGQILEQPGEIRLYDLYCRQVRLTTTATNISNHTIRVADLPNGVYFYKASLNSRNFAGKLVIKH